MNQIVIYQIGLIRGGWGVGDKNPVNSRGPGGIRAKAVVNAVSRNLTSQKIQVVNSVECCQCAPRWSADVVVANFCAILIIRIDSINIEILKDIVADGI